MEQHVEEGSQWCSCTTTTPTQTEWNFVPPPPNGIAKYWRSRIGIGNPEKYAVLLPSPSNGSYKDTTFFPVKWLHKARSTPTSWERAWKEKAENQPSGTEHPISHTLINCINIIQWDLIVSHELVSLFTSELQNKRKQCQDKISFFALFIHLFVVFCFLSQARQWTCKVYLRWGSNYWNERQLEVCAVQRSRLSLFEVTVWYELLHMLGVTYQHLTCRKKNTVVPFMSKTHSLLWNSIRTLDTWQQLQFFFIITFDSAIIFSCLL